MEAIADSDQAPQQQTQTENIEIPAESQVADNEPSSPNTQGSPRSSKLHKVYIGGLPEDTQEADLQDCFGQFGGIKSIELKTGYGFVEFETHQAAEESVAVFHEGTFLGNVIRVELSHGKNASKPSEGGKCFQCGQLGHWARECPNHTVDILEKKQKRTDFHRDPQPTRGTRGYPNRPYGRQRYDNGYNSGSRDFGYGNRIRDGVVDAPKRHPSPTQYSQPSHYPTYSQQSHPSRGGYAPNRRYSAPMPRPGYADRPSTPHSYGARQNYNAGNSRNFSRGYERENSSYEPRAFPPGPPPPYSYSNEPLARRSEVYSSPIPEPPPGSYGGYPRDHSGRRSPFRNNGRYQNNSQIGYNRPNERRRSASPPRGGNYINNSNYSRGSYGRPQQYGSNGSGYIPPGQPTGPRGPPPVAMPPIPADRDYRGYRP